MRRMVYGLLVIMTLGLFVMTIWTNSISREVFFGEEQSEADTFDYIEESPISWWAEVTVLSSEMYEGVLTTVWFNLTGSIDSNTPMVLTIDSIEILLTPLDYQSRIEADLPKTIGWYPLTQLKLENVTSVNIVGMIQITPVIITGEIFLGLGVDYFLDNRTSPGPSCEYGDDCWFGVDGSLLMIPVSVQTSILRSEGWSGAFAVSLLTSVLFTMRGRRK